MSATPLDPNSVYMGGGAGIQPVNPPFKLTAIGNPTNIRQYKSELFVPIGPNPDLTNCPAPSWQLFPRR